MPKLLRLQPSWLDRVMGKLCQLWEVAKGESTVREVFAPARIQAKVIATSLANYQLSLYCQKHHYARIYDRFFVRTRHHVLYRVTGTVSSDAPDVLKHACENTSLAICSCTHWAVNEDFQERLAVKAYLDMLVSYMQTHTA